VIDGHRVAVMETIPCPDGADCGPGFKLAHEDYLLVDCLGADFAPGALFGVPPNGQFGLGEVRKVRGLASRSVVAVRSDRPQDCVWNLAATDGARNDRTKGGIPRYCEVLREIAVHCTPGDD
jgi:hypothetical protein